MRTRPGMTTGDSRDGFRCQRSCRGAERALARETGPRRTWVPEQMFRSAAPGRCVRQHRRFHARSRRRRQNADDPLGGLELREVPDPVVPDGWAKVAVRSSALNMHDVWTLRGVGHPADRIPMILGCDAAGVDENGNEVIVYPVIADADGGMGDETLDPNARPAVRAARRRVRRVPRGAPPQPDPQAGLVVVRRGRVPARRLDHRVPDAVHPGADQGRRPRAGAGRRGWRRHGRDQPGRGCRAKVYAASRSADKRATAIELGAHAAVEAGARLPERSTSSSRRSARPRGRTRCVRCDRAARSSSRARRPAPTRPPTSPGSSTCSSASSLDRMYARRTGVDAADDGGHRSAAEDRSRHPAAGHPRGFQAMIDGDVNGKVVGEGFVSIWFGEPSVELVNRKGADTLNRNLGIELTGSPTIRSKAACRSTNGPSSPPESCTAGRRSRSPRPSRAGRRSSRWIAAGSTASAWRSTPTTCVR